MFCETDLTFPNGILFIARNTDTERRPALIIQGQHSVATLSSGAMATQHVVRADDPHCAVTSMVSCELWTDRRTDAHIYRVDCWRQLKRTVTSQESMTQRHAASVNDAVYYIELIR